MKDIFLIYNKTNFVIKPYKNDFNEIFKIIKITLKIIEPLELSLIIVNTKEQLEINKKYRHKNYVADVISFSLEEKNKINLFKLTGYRNLGDIFICFEKALIQSFKYNHSPRREFSFLFIHGMLHILGYNHKTIYKEKKMFNLQKKILNKLKINKFK